MSGVHALASRTRQSLKTRTMFKPCCSATTRRRASRYTRGADDLLGDQGLCLGCAHRLGLRVGQAQLFAGRLGRIVASHYLCSLSSGGGRCCARLPSIARCLLVGHPVSGAVSGAAAVPAHGLGILDQLARSNRRLKNRDPAPAPAPARALLGVPDQFAEQLLELLGLLRSDRRVNCFVVLVDAFPEPRDQP